MTDAAPTLASARAVPRAGARRRLPGKGFHGWRIVGVLAVTETVSWGVLYYAFAVFQVPMADELGFTAAELAGAFSLAVLLTGLAAVPVGRWLDARGPRGLMTAGSVVSALLVAAWSQVRTLEGLYLVMAAIGLARASVLYDPAFAVIVRWFHQRRGSALLVVTLVAGFASTIALPGSNALIEWLGWRDALLVLASVLAVVTVVPHWLVLRRDPADLGLHPDGASSPPVADRVRQPGRAGGARRTATWAAREPVFRWYAAGFAAQASAVIVVSVHLVPLLREQGHGAAFAATATGALGALSVSGRLVLTGLGRRFSPAGVTAALFALQAAAAGLLLAVGGTTVGAVAFVLLFGLGFGAGTIAKPAVLAQAFGTLRYGTLSGLMALLITLATTAGAFLAGLARTAYGSYGPVVVAVSALCVVGSMCLLRAARHPVE